MDFNNKSYELHSNLYNNTDEQLAKQWTNEETVDYWRHKRMYDMLLPVLVNYPNANWLTVGDGKYGTDAHYILKYTPNVLPTDISEACLKIAKEEGFKSVIMGVWNPNSNLELQNAKNQAYYVSAYCVGNEGLYGRYSLSDLNNAYDFLKVTGKPISTSEERNDYLID